MRICRRSRLRKKAFIFLFMYMMAFGYMYMYLIQYIAMETPVSQLSMDDIKVQKNVTYKKNKLVEGQKNQLMDGPKNKSKGGPKIVLFSKSEKNIKERKNLPKQLQQKNIKQNFQKTTKKTNGAHLKKSYLREFKYPLFVNLTQLVQQLEQNKSIDVQPINPHPYNFLYSPTEACGYDPKIKYPRILILVKSSIQNFIKREVIRQTWASVKKENIDIVFLLGLPKQGNLAVRKESVQYGDIIQENFIDNYRNNTLKMIMGFKWAVSNCKWTDYLFFVDDDYYVNVNNVHVYLHSVNQVTGKNTLFSGTLLGSSIPYRVSGSKWYMPWEDYPFDRYPPYLAGGAYFVSFAIARKLYLAFQYVKPMHIDDVYLGIVAKKLNIKPTGTKKIGYRKLQKGSLKTVIASHGYSNNEEVKAAWDFLNKKPEPTVRKVNKKKDKNVIKQRS